MFGLDPVLTVLLLASAAALAAALGVVPQIVAGRLPLTVLGWANALASGLMLGVAYSLVTLELNGRAVTGAVAAVLGVVLIRGVQAGMGTADLDLNEIDELSPRYGYKIFLVNSFHAACEGVAIGVAMLVSVPFGVSMVAALAVHNVPEAMILTAVVAGRGVSTGQTALLAVGANLNQILWAVVTFVVVGAHPVLLPWAAGFAVGALIYLVLADLLPESYRQAGHTSIALVTLIAMAMVLALSAGAGPF